MKPRNWQLWWANWDILVASRVMSALTEVVRKIHRHRHRHDVPVVDGGFIFVQYGRRRWLCKPRGWPYRAED